MEGRAAGARGGTEQQLLARKTTADAHLEVADVHLCCVAMFTVRFDCHDTSGGITDQPSMAGTAPTDFHFTSALDAAPVHCSVWLRTGVPFFAPC